MAWGVYENLLTKTSMRSVRETPYQIYPEYKSSSLPEIASGV